MAMVWSSSGDIAICYVLPVLWMTSHLTVVGHMRCVPSGVAILGRSRMSMNALFLVCDEGSLLSLCMQDLRAVVVIHDTLINPKFVFFLILISVTLKSMSNQA